MSAGTLRQQGADACRAYFAELGEDLSELCAAGHGSTVSKALTIRAITAAVEAVGTQGEASVQTFAECFVEQANAEINALRNAQLSTRFEEA